MNRCIVIVSNRAGAAPTAARNLSHTAASLLAGDMRQAPFSWPETRVVRLPRRLFRGRHGMRAYHSTYCLTHGMRPNQVL